MLVDVTTQLDKTQRLLRQLLAAKIGTHSEQISAAQLALFARELGIDTTSPAEQESKGEDRDPDPPAASTSDEKKPRGRQALPRHLKRERVIHELAEADKHCSDCQQALRHIGAEVSDRYEYIPAQMLVIEDACQKYACPCKIRTANKPAQPIERSTASASVLAQVIVSKVADHLPVHRQAKIFRRLAPICRIRPYAVGCAMASAPSSFLRNSPAPQCKSFCLGICVQRGPEGTRCSASTGDRAPVKFWYNRKGARFKTGTDLKRSSVPFRDLVNRAASYSTETKGRFVFNSCGIRFALPAA